MREEIYQIPDSDGPFRVSLAGISYCDGSYHIVRKNSETFVIEYIVEGSGTVICDGRRFRAQSGDVYMLRAGHAHDYFSDADTPWVKMWFNASGALIEALTDAYGLGNRVVFERAELRGEFEEAVELCRSGGEGVSGEIAMIFHRMVRKLAEMQPQEGGRSEEAVIMRKYLDANVSQKADLGMLADLIYKSVSQSIRLFRKEYGQTPYEYLIGRRMALAQELLRSTNMLIKEVAYRAGFMDEHYFSVAFRRRFGMSPREYRSGGGQRPQE